MQLQPKRRRFRVRWLDVRRIDAAVRRSVAALVSEASGGLAKAVYGTAWEGKFLIPLFRTEKKITRAMLRKEPKTLFVFGDNIAGSGYGGQAAAMRGEPNAVGIPTKWLPARTEAAYFTDDDFDRVRPRIDAEFVKLATHLNHGGRVVWPEAGIGTGLAELPTRAPTIYALIIAGRALLEEGACIASRP